MITSPLLSNVRHRKTITPVSPLLTRLIHISPSCWQEYGAEDLIAGQFIVRLKLFSK